MFYKQSRLLKNILLPLVTLIVVALSTSCSKKMSKEECTNIASEISGLVTSEGVGIYRFGQPMGEVLSGNYKQSELSIWLLKGIDKQKFKNTSINYYAISENPITTDSSDLSSVKHSDSTDSEINNFRIQIFNEKDEDWIGALINELISDFEQKGFSVFSREHNNQKSMIILAKDTFNVFIMNNSPDAIEVVSGFYIRNSLIYNDFYKIFLSAKIGVLS